MNFFDGIIDETKELLPEMGKNLIAPDYGWKDLGRNELVLQRDAMAELDGTGFNLVTSRDIGETGIEIIGKDLKDIKSDCKFARISLIQTDDFEDEQKYYDVIRKIEYAKYHYFPEGYMIRTSSGTHSEIIRVSGKGVRNGLSFVKAGSLLLKKYLENDSVKAARIIYVTDPTADYNALRKLAEKNYSITETLNHIMSNITLDCNVCKLKPICDEVEGMKELHFKNAGM